MCHILIVDDIEDHIACLKTLLEEEGYFVQTTFGRWSALELIQNWRPDLALSDVILCDIVGY